MINWPIVRALHVRAQNLVAQIYTNHDRRSITPSKHLLGWASTTPKVIAANRGGGGVEFSATVARGSTRRPILEFHLVGLVEGCAPLSVTNTP